MKKISQIGDFGVYLLDKQVAKKYAEDITKIWNLIPLSNHAPEDILQESSGSSQYYGKWEHSLIVLDEKTEQVVAFVVGYERAAEKNQLYTKDSLHLKSLSVANNYQNQGIGRKLITIWLAHNRQEGFHHLTGKLIFSTQTNSAEWNIHVQKFYESFEFTKIGLKQYSNKTDVVYFLESEV